MLLPKVAEVAEAVELERQVFPSVKRSAEMAPVPAELVAADASKLDWVAGRRTRKLLMMVGADIPF